MRESNHQVILNYENNECNDGMMGVTVANAGLVWHPLSLKKYFCRILMVTASLGWGC